MFMLLHTGVIENHAALLTACFGEFVRALMLGVSTKNTNAQYNASEDYAGDQNKYDTLHIFSAFNTVDKPHPSHVTRTRLLRVTDAAQMRADHASDSFRQDLLSRWIFLCIRQAPPCFG